MLALMLFFVHLKKMRKKRTTFFASLCWEEYYMHQFSHDLHRLLNVQKNGSPAASFLLFWVWFEAENIYSEWHIVCYPLLNATVLRSMLSFFLLFSFVRWWVCLFTLFVWWRVHFTSIYFFFLNSFRLDADIICWLIFFQKEKSNDWDNTRTHTRTQHCCI